MKGSEKMNCLAESTKLKISPQAAAQTIGCMSTYTTTHKQNISFGVLFCKNTEMNELYLNN